ncbi:cupin domain-containing protein (plasmid) [Rhizobium leguminosarum]
MLDYYAPAKFGPPRHVHRQDDELFLIVAGSVLIWTPDEVQTAEAGDTVFLPRGKEHTWKGYGDDPINLQVVVSPGEFERFIPTVVEQRLTAEDIAALARVADEAGMDITGPPINDTELAEYLAALA